MTVTSDAPGSTEFPLAGDVDEANAAEIGDRLCELATNHDAVVVVGSEVTFVESRGLAMMARVQRVADECGCDLSWRGFPLHVLRTIHVTGLDRYLRIEA
jgi:anti-anti-sigma factor